MKQRISVEQLAELSEEQKDRLREWWKPEIGDWAIIAAETLADGSLVTVTNYHPEYKLCGLDFIPNKGFCSYTKEYLLPLLSIGQCIQMISDEGHTEVGSCNLVAPTWTVLDPSMEEFTDTELIDTLWQAVKSVL